MSLQNINERVEWVESEYKKWEEMYEILFEDEFNVKALLSLRHQFSATPDDHTKTKVDLLHAMKGLQRDLGLKPIMRNSLNSNTWYITIERLENKTACLFINAIKSKSDEVRIINVANDMFRAKRVDPNTTLDLGELVGLLFDKLLENRPNRIVFDKMGMGTAVYDQFISILRLNKNVSISNKGVLKYYNE